MSAERPRMTLANLRAVSKGSLLAFAAVLLPSGLRVNDCPVMLGKSGPWVALPNKPMIGRDGQPVVGADGRKKYSPILSWPDKATAARWSDAVVALIQAEHPDLFDDGSSAAAAQRPPGNGATHPLDDEIPF